jgi:hypothetical protein
VFEKIQCCASCDKTLKVWEAESGQVFHLIQVTCDDCGKCNESPSDPTQDPAAIGCSAAELRPPG